ncbi:hypothetical protein AGR7C_pTi0004 [Agrobacterium deltaense Zutra 3/1]|uniref:Uncharacterized protein n=1 Tax=Agrobacterium deltaense Zutra 3/1 TaxID=1183427 RepID=A0A1S7S4Z1_9HYPH|nr:hypothetical protein AGR7C_pTi0004 [Agrobacterium deltaense Zutra 3/1]
MDPGCFTGPIAVPKYLSSIKALVTVK